MRVLSALSMSIALVTAACTGSSSPTTPSTSATMTGAWTGTSSDSTGSMMGAGLTASMMGNTSWSITQNGNAFTGTMQFPGYMGGQMTVSGTMNGHSGTFTMTMPSGSMMSSACSATANGTFDMDDMMTQFHGTYSGTNSCSGMFNNGHMSMMHR